MIQKYWGKYLNFSLCSVDLKKPRTYKQAKWLIELVHYNQHSIIEQGFVFWNDKKQTYYFDPEEERLIPEHHWKEILRFIKERNREVNNNGK